MLFQLEVRNAVHQQAARAIGTLEERDAMSGAIELLSGSHARRPAADDRYALAGAHLWRLGDDPTLGEAAVGDRHFDFFDRDRIFIDPQHASRFARSRANAPGELRKVIRGVQPIERALPLTAKDQVVPVRNDVPQRAARVAERHSAVHAPRALLAQFGLGQNLQELVVMLQTFRNRLIVVMRSAEFEKPSHITHVPPLAALPVVVTSSSRLSFRPSHACSR